MKNKSRKQHIKFILMLIPVFIFIFFLFCFFTPTLKIKESYISNISYNSVTLIWKTEVPSTGRVIITSEPVKYTDFFSQSKYLDARESFESSRTYSHLISIYDIEPETEYYLSIVDNLNKPILKDIYFKTKPISESLATPDPVYGTVYNSEGDSIGDAIVSIKLKTDNMESELRSSYSNKDGGFSLDLSGIKVKDSNINFGKNEEFIEEIKVWDANGQELIKEVDPDHDQPIGHNGRDEDLLIINNQDLSEKITGSVNAQSRDSAFEHKTQPQNESFKQQYINFIPRSNQKTIPNNVNNNVANNNTTTNTTNANTTTTGDDDELDPVPSTTPISDVIPNPETEVHIIPNIPTKERKSNTGGLTASSGDPWISTSALDTGNCERELNSGFGWTTNLQFPAEGDVRINSKRVFSPTHTGIDINGKGNAVAAAGGKVVWAGYSVQGSNTKIVIDHGGGWHTYYFHLDNVIASCNSTVSKGQVIGTIGASGADWQHLHFEVRNGGVAYDPCIYFSCSTDSSTILNNSLMFQSNAQGFENESGQNDYIEVEKGKYDITGFVNNEIYIEEDGILLFYEDINGDKTFNVDEPVLSNSEMESKNIRVTRESDIQSFDLEIGWNSISFPIYLSGENEEVTKASRLQELLKSQDVEVTHIIKYSNGNFVNYSVRENENNEEFIYGDDFNIIPGEGYFIKSYSKGTITLEGRKIEGTNVTYKKNPGWNLVGIVVDDIDTKVYIEQNNNVTVISKWESGIYNNLINIDNNFYGNHYPLYPNKSYWVKVEDI